MIDHLPAYKTPASGTMETWLNKQDAISEKAQDDIESTLKIFRALTTDPKLNKVFHKPTLFTYNTMVWTLLNVIIIVIHLELATQLEQAALCF